MGDWDCHIRTVGKSPPIQCTAAPSLAYGYMSHWVMYAGSHASANIKKNICILHKREPGILFSLGGPQDSQKKTKKKESILYKC